MRERSCAVAVLPAEGGDPGRLLRSLDLARAHGLGDLREAEALPLPRTTHPHDALAEAAARAAREGFGWLFAASAAETLMPDVFVKSAPALRLFDAVWGAAGLVRADGTATPLERVTRLAAQDPAMLFHCALRWWIGPSHFVRPEAALAALPPDDGPAWYADYLLALWRRGRPLKTAQALTTFHGRLPPVPEPVGERLLRELDAAPAFMDVSHEGGAVRLPYTGRNPTIEREQTRGRFFEHEELAHLAGRLPRGLSVVDAGANTGNHTIFFAAAMAAESVLPIEPDARAAAALRAAVAENRLANVDPSWLGFAAGAAPSRMRAVPSAGGGLGATRLAPDPDGPVRVRPLDDLAERRADLLKIDVEGMEMAVLAGARALIARHRPVLFVEVLDETVGEFLAWADAHHYAFEKLFPDKTHCNYVLVPIDVPQRRGA